MKSAEQNQNGFSLIELLIVVALIGILSALASLGFDFVRRERLASATKELVADIQKQRTDAVVSKQSTTLMTGAGIRFDTAASTSYVLFNFMDSAVPTNFAYSGASEEFNPRTRQLNESLSLQIAPGTFSSNLFSILIYDSTGFPRRFKPDGTSVPDENDLTKTAGQMVLLVTETGLNRTKCITIGLSNIREGNWDGAICSEQ